MEQSRCLGIYVAPDRAVVALAAKSAGKIEVLEHFAVDIQQQQQPAQPFSFAQAAKDIAAICQERQLAFTEVAVAVDCRLYRQQTLHSEFTDHKQIAQTIKFDAEEILAVNAAETAIAFEVVGRGLSGSDVMVFAAEARVVSEIILALQSNKLDPVIVEPDAICLRRIIQQMPAEADTRPMWVAVSQKKCFLISPVSQIGVSPVRAFLTSSRNRDSAIAREIMLTMTATASSPQVQKIKIFDTQVGIDASVISRQTSLMVDIFNADELVGTKPIEQNSYEKLDVIIAAGAAAGLLFKCERVDFRPLFLPYQGKKEIIERTIKLCSIVSAVIVVLLGMFFHLYYYRINSDRAKLIKKLKAEYAIAMPSSKFTRSSEAVRKLRSEINRIRDVRSGLISATGEDSIEARLTFLLEALNSVPKEVDIDIDKIAITAKMMNITGSTSSRGYLQLFAAIDRHPRLSRSSSSYQSKDNRDYFALTIELKQ